MKTFVVDCSVTAAWLLDEGAAGASGLLAGLAQGRALVPALWRIETANVMASAIRRKRLDEAGARRALALLLEAPIDVDEAVPASPVLFDLSRRHGLSAYDACYLELCMRRGLPLATLDRALRQAAVEAGCAVLQ